MTAADQRLADPPVTELAPGRPVVFRGGTVLTMDDAHRILPGADVLISGERIVVNGRIVKYGHRLVGVDLAKARDVVGQTVEHLMRELGQDAWTDGMHPEIPPTEVRDNPYTYTDWDAGSAQWKK